MNLKYAYFFPLLVVRFSFFWFLFCIVLCCRFEFVKFGPFLFIAFYFYLPIVNNNKIVLSKCDLVKKKREEKLSLFMMACTFSIIPIFYDFN